MRRAGRRSRSPATVRRSLAENLRDEFDAKPEVLPRDPCSMSSNSTHQGLLVFSKDPVEHILVHNILLFIIGN